MHRGRVYSTGTSMSAHCMYGYIMLDATLPRTSINRTIGLLYILFHTRKCLSPGPYEPVYSTLQ